MESDTDGDNSVATSRIEIEGMEYDMNEFVECDNDVVCTKVLNESQIRDAVVDDAICDDFDEDDLIPLAELRTKITAIGSFDPNTANPYNKLFVSTHRCRISNI